MRLCPDAARYLHLNPVKVRGMGNVGKGERRRYLETYGWSSYRGYADERRQEDFVCYEVLRTLSEHPRTARHRYRTYVHGCLMKDDGELRGALDRSGGCGHGEGRCTGVGVPADGPDAEGDWEAARRDQFAGGEPGAEAREGARVGGSSDPAGGSAADKDGNGLNL